jgi:drug/metabolite transporter (DMT)-like permease
MKNKNKIGDFAILGATLIWGSSFVVMKDTLNSVPTFYLLAIRFITASGILELRSLMEWKKISFTYVKYGLITGVFHISANVLQTFGQCMTTPGKKAILTTVYCITVPFLYWIIAKENRINLISSRRF